MLRFKLTTFTSHQMSQGNTLHYEREQNIMILALESDFEVLGMDENDYHEASMFLTPFDDDGKDATKPNDCYSTALADCRSSIQVDNNEDFLEVDTGGEIVPSKVSSQTSVKEGPEKATPPQNIERECSERRPRRI